MASTNEDPVRLEEARPYKRSSLPIVRTVVLPPKPLLTCPFDLALKRRRSADLFGPIAPEELGTLLAFTAGLQGRNVTDSNRQRRYVGSFGALHPAHILIGTVSHSWSVYLPAQHALGVLQVERRAARLLRQEAEACHVGGSAVLIALLADVDLAESYYRNALQLLLRDGGVLLGHASLVAAASNLPFRILGTVGGDTIKSLIPGMGFRSMGTGIAWIGGANIESRVGEVSPDDQIDSLLAVG